MTRHYDRAPIVEAIIDLRAPLPEPADRAVFDTFAKTITSDFPAAKEILAVNMELHHSVDGKGASKFSSEQQKVGLRFDSPNNQRVLQVQLAGFSYSHLPPYTDWGTFRQEALGLWSQYLEITHVSQVLRTAVRVINKIPLEGTVEDLPRYSNLCLKLPSGIPTAPEAFFTQFQLSGSRWFEGARVVVNSGAAPRPDGKLEFLLDFDIFVEGSRGAASPETWDILDKLSQAKDELFEACITDDVRELIK